MAITASDVKKLRDITGAGMMDCKKALNDANGDLAQAEKILKEMGLAAVAKRQDRATNNGRVFAAVAGNKAILLELSCETDFVAKNLQFKELGEKMCAVALEKGYSEINDELNSMVQELIATIKENMSLKRLQVIEIPENGIVSEYIHGEGSVAVLVVLTATNAAELANPVVTEFAHDCALHVAAYKPQFLSQNDISDAYKAEQTEIFKAQVSQDEKLATKPAKVIDGIIAGRLNKLYKEICLLDQTFVKDDSVSVEAKAKAISKDITVASYNYYQTGVEA